MKVAIIGGGLVGRLAAWAVMQQGHVPTIFDPKEYASIPRGFVYLHDPCDLPLRAEKIHVLEQGGTPIDYSIKVYGQHTTPPDVSFGKYSGLQTGYSPAEVLNILNGLQHHMTRERTFKDFGDVLELREDFERLVFTLPASNFLPGVWPFRQCSVAAYKLDEGEVLENFCVYNANHDIPWYRAGHMFGYAFYEFIDIARGHPIMKVMGDRPRFPTQDNVLFTGRFGSWNRSALSHDTYYEVLSWLTDN